MFKIISLSFLLMLSKFSFSQWFQQTSGVTTDLNSVFFVNNDYGFIVGNSGTFIKTTNGGMNWTSTVINPSQDFHDVYFITQNEGIIVGSGGLILRTTDGGSIWNTITSGVTDNLFSVSFSGLNGLIGGSSQTILYSTNGGVSWSIAQTGFFGGGFWGTSMLSSQTGFVAGENSIFQPMLGKTTDTGQTWDFIPFYLNNNEGRATGVDFTDQNIGYVSASVWDGTGAIAKTTDNGINWLTTFFNNPLWDINFPISGASLVGYAVGNTGTIFKTTNAGNTWLPLQSGTSSNLNKVHFVDLNFGFAIGEGGVILNTINGGIPVELTSFTCNLAGNKIYLNWQTASEINNRGFYVERNTKDEWISLAFIKGSGTTTEEQIYFFTDELSNLEYSGIIQYRLKQVDYDGSFEYSFIVEAEYNSQPYNYELYQNYPNPFNPSTTIRYTIPEERFVSIKIYDITGKEVMTLTDEVKVQGSYEVKADGSELSSGVYFYKMTAGNFSSVKQLLLIK